MVKYSVIDYAVEPPISPDLATRFNQKLGTFLVREEGGLEVAFREPDVRRYLESNPGRDPAYAAQPLGNFYAFLHDEIAEHKKPSKQVRHILVIRQSPDPKLSSYTRVSVSGACVKSRFARYLGDLGLENKAGQRLSDPNSMSPVWEPPEQIVQPKSNLRGGYISDLKKPLRDLGFKRKKREN